MKVLSFYLSSDFGGKCDIDEKIAQSKNEMKELSESFGILHERTIAKSQEIDRLMNQYMLSRYLSGTKKQLF